MRRLIAALCLVAFVTGLDNGAARSPCTPTSERYDPFDNVPVPQCAAQAWA